MTQSLEAAKDICKNAIYHTETVDWKGQVAMGVVGLIGITALVVGILAYLQVSPGLGAIPQQAVYTMITVGSVLVLGDLIAMAILGIKHARMKQQMQGVVDSDLGRPYHADHSRIDQMLRIDKIVEVGQPYYNSQEVQHAHNADSKVYLVVEHIPSLMSRKTLHVYNNVKSQQEHVDNLVKNNYTRFSRA